MKTACSSAKYRRTLAPKQRVQSGMALLEGLIAMLIFVIGILGLIGLQANMVKSTVDSQYRAEAGYVAQKRLAEIWTTAESNRGTLAEENTDISTDTGLPGGLRDTIRGAPEPGCDGSLECYIVVVKWTPPGGAQHNYSIVAHIK